MEEKTQALSREEVESFQGITIDDEHISEGKKQRESSRKTYRSFQVIGWKDLLHMISWKNKLKIGAYFLVGIVLLGSFFFFAAPFLLVGLFLTMVFYFFTRK